MDSPQETPSPSPRRWRDFAIALLSAVFALAAADGMLRDSRFSRAVDSSSQLPGRARMLAASRFDVVVAGSSVIAEGLNPGAASERIHDLTGERRKVLNAGVSAGGFAAYFMLADRIVELPKERRPLLYVFSVSPMEFSCCPPAESPSEDKWGPALRPGDLFPLLSAAPSFDEASKDLLFISFRSVAIRSYVLGALFDLQAPQPWDKPADGGGGTIDPNSADEQDSRARHRVEAFRPGMLKPRKVDRDAPARYIRAMTERLARAGVKTVMVGNPQAPQMAVLDGPDSIYPEYAEHLTKLGKELGIGFTNYRDWADVTAADFVNGDHLNKNGALKFSRKLAEEVIVPALKGER